MFYPGEILYDDAIFHNIQSRMPSIEVDGKTIEELALEFNAELTNIKKSRETTDLDLANVSINNYGPLIKLKRYDEAERFLWACKEVFEKEKSIEGLALSLPPWPI